MAVRSVRNNNPGNIRTNSTKWKGKTGDDGSFVTFDTPEKGVRAMAKTLETYQNKHGLTTTAQIINRYAPTSENNTQAYINAVAKSAGVDPNQEIDLSANPALHKKFIAAMIKHEGGAEAAEYFGKGNTIDNGIKMAVDEDFDNKESPLDDTEANNAMLEAQREQEAEGIDKVDETTEDQLDPAESKRQILNSASSLAELIERMEKKNLFWDNELDKFQQFTYNLELFVVNQQEAAKFLAYENIPTLLNDVVNDAWPTDQIEKITIAKTGVTTELNITDLNVQSTGYGNVNTSRMAGTAITLDFNITQVGGTSLPDMLNNTALLCGYPNTASAVYFMKIKFLGYDDNDTVTRNFPATKVLPFRLRSYRNLQTTTDARGTTTRLEGTIIADTVITDTSVGQVDYNFEFDIKDTLGETLDSFFEALNTSVKDKAIISDPNFINEYKFELSDEFKEKFGQAEMKDPNNPNMASGNNKTDKKKSIKLGMQTGVITPGVSIYNAIESIIMNAKQVREELLESKDKETDLFNIKPHGEPKLKGYNVLSASYCYNITYFINLHKVILPKNQIDNANLISKTAGLLRNIFLSGRCHKRYYYTYTGKNDQIIDFNVQLTEQLQKSYSQPGDAYMANVFLDQIGDYRKEIDEKALQKLTELEAEAKVLQQEFDKEEQEAEQLIKDFKQMNTKLKNEFMDRLVNQYGVGFGKLGRLDASYIRKADINQIGSILQTDAESGNAKAVEAYEIFNDILKGETRKNFNKLNNQVRDAKLESNAALKKLEENQRENDNVTREALGHLLSNKALEATSAIQESWQGLGLSDTNGDPGIVLTEELDREIVAKLSLQQFSALMKTLVENPINFARITKPLLANPTKLNVVKHPNQEEVELAQEKYYEGKAGNLSMIRATMTIKGDPFWIETMLPVEVEKGNFGTKNSNEDYKMHSTQFNGYNYCAIIVDKAEGNFLNDADRIGQDAANSDGIKKTRLETMIYMVNSITSSFSGGQFTQTLEMVKQPSASTFKEFQPKLFNVGAPENWGDEYGVVYTNIEAEKGLNDDVVEKEKQSADADNIADSAVGAGSDVSQDVDGDGVNDRINPSDPSTGFAQRNAALTASVNAFVSESPFATEAQAKAVANALSYMEGACLQGHVASCNAKDLAYQDLATYRGTFTDATDARDQINEFIDNGGTVSPATIAVMDQAYEGLGQAKIQDGVVNVNQAEIDAFNDEIDNNTKAYVVGNNDMIFNPKDALQNIEPSDNGTAGADALINGDISLTDKGIRVKNSSTQITNGMISSRSYGFEIDTNTLTEQEMNNVKSLNNEAQDIIGNKGLHQLTDEEYSRVKTIEDTIDDIERGATTGTRGEIRDSLEADRLKTQIEKDEAELKEKNDDLDSWYWTEKGRREDEERKAELQQSIADNREKLQDIEQDPVSGIVSSKDANGELVHTPVEVAVKVTDPDIGNIPVKIGDDNRVDIVTQDGIQNYQQDGDGQLTNAQVAEYKGASSVYNQIIEQANNKPKIALTDEFGTEEVLDYSNLDPISYQDENGNTVTIQDPSTHFGLVDTTKGANDVERYQLNSTTLKNKVASSSNFPNVETTNVRMSSTDRNDSDDVLQGRIGKNDFVVVAQERVQEQEDGPQQ
tara:strand:+ start:1255 stop:6138 length:4884 start_codon:yes stop_codon:yes gene_type:complete